MNLHHAEPIFDTKTRRKEDQRRMAFRRAIEDYAEQRRLQHEFDDYASLIAISSALPRSLSEQGVV